MNASPSRDYRWAAFAALGLPLFLMLAWNCIAFSYPSTDAADYARATLEILRKFENSGWRGGFEAVFFLRIWKPIFSPSSVCLFWR